MHFYIPKVNNIPNLSTLNKPVILNLMLNRAFGGSGQLEYQARAFHSGFVRTMDKAIFEYESARKCLDRAIARNYRIANYFRCLAHLETCVNSIKRAISFLERLKRCLRDLPVERMTRKLIESHFNNIRNVRDTVEHIDEHILKGEVKKGDPLVLAIPDDEKSIQISNHKIRFDQLASVIRNLHTIAENLAKYPRKKQK